jgi:hypothetical protein
MAERRLPASVMQPRRGLGDFRVLPSIQLEREFRFAARFVAAILDLEHAREHPVRLEPVGVGGDGGAETASLVIAAVGIGVEHGQVIPGVERVFGRLGCAERGVAGLRRDLDALEFIRRALRQR